MSKLPKTQFKERKRRKEARRETLRGREKTKRISFASPHLPTKQLSSLH